MKISHEEHDQVSVLTIKGDMIADSVDDFRKVALERMKASTRDFVLDLSRLKLIDSKGLEALVWLQDECAGNLGQVRLAGPDDNTRTILEMTRLVGRFDCHQDVESAIKSLG